MLPNFFMQVHEIDYQLAQAIVVKYHYLHRKSNYIVSYGLYNKGELLGVCVFGKPASNNVCLLCGEDEKDHVIELVRFFTVDDGMKNKESFFIAQCLKLLPNLYDIVISYADSGMNHVGIIYQATNWHYFGLSDPHVEWIVKDSDNCHSRHKFDKYGGVNNAKQMGLLERSERSRKHRYVYFRGSKSRRAILMRKLKFRNLIQSYPKGDKILANDITEKIIESQPILF